MTNNQKPEALPTTKGDHKNNPTDIDQIYDGPYAPPEAFRYPGNTQPLDVEWAGKGYKVCDNICNPPTDEEVQKFLEEHPTWFQSWVKRYDRVHGTHAMQYPHGTVSEETRQSLLNGTRGSDHD